MTFEHWLCSLWHCVTLGHGRAWCHHDCYMTAMTAMRLQGSNSQIKRTLEPSSACVSLTHFQVTNEVTNCASTAGSETAIQPRTKLTKHRWTSCIIMLVCLLLRPLLQDQSALAAEELQGQDAHALRGMSLASLSHFRIKTFPKTCPKQNYSTLLLSSHLFSRTCSEKFFHHFHPLPLSFYKSNFRQTSHAWCHHLTRWKQMTQWLLNEENSTMKQEIYEWPMQKTTWREWTSWHEIGRKDCHARAFRRRKLHCVLLIN